MKNNNSRAKIDSVMLDSYLGLNVSQFCPHGYVDNSYNHCAHFVCHALGMAIGYTCRAASSRKTAAAGACIRVHEVFKNCPSVSSYMAGDDGGTARLIFVTAPGNVHLASKTMTNVPKKHIGVLLGDKIWHYSNRRDKVVNASPAEFLKHYPSQKNGLFIGEVPKNIVPAPYSER